MSYAAQRYEMVAWCADMDRHQVMNCTIIYVAVLGPHSVLPVKR